MIFEKFRQAVREHGLLSPGDRVLAAVSGGADSVALLRLLLRHAEQVDLTIVAAHVNHRLRGAAADEDQRFVERLAAGLGVACVVLKPEGPPGAAPPFRGEEGARRARHTLLVRAAREAGCRRIVLGHTMDDQAETVLMRLVRGAGRRGIAAMSFAGPGSLVRPMLGIRRSEVLGFLAEIGQEFREDETNADERFLRNKVRARLVPLLEELNPSIVVSLARTADVISEEDRYLDGLAADWVARSAASRPGGLAAPAADLAGLPRALARRAARLLLKGAGADPRGASLATVEAVLEMAGRTGRGAWRPLPGGMRAAREGLDLVVGRQAAPAGRAAPAAYSVAMKVPGGSLLPGSAGAIRATVVPRSLADEAAPGRARACLDAELLGPVVSVRTRLPGDTFHPLGAPGRRKLKEFLIDLKVPRNERDRIPLVVGPAGIAWVVGHRIGHAYRLTETTRSVAVLEHRGPVDLPDA